jgi:hypothetical protein
MEAFRRAVRADGDGRSRVVQVEVGKKCGGCR